MCVYIVPQEGQERRSGSAHFSTAYTLSKGRSIGKDLVTSSGPASQGPVMRRLKWENRFVGIPFIFTNLYDLCTLPPINFVTIFSDFSCLIP